MHPKPPLTQPTTFPIPSATKRGHLKPGGKRVQLSVCKRKTTGHSRREQRPGRREAQQGPESHVKSEKQERGRDEISEGERGEQSKRPRESDRQRHAGSGPGLSLAKVKAFASCQLETAALSQKDAALHHFCLLVCSSVFVCLSKRTAWRLQSAESSADVLKHKTRTICVTGYT